MRKSAGRPEPCRTLGRVVALSLAISAGLAAQPAAVEPDALIRQAFGRLYNFDFRGAHQLVDRHMSQNAADPLGPAVRAAAYLFSELSRLRILEFDFFMDDDKFVDRRKLTPDPAIRQAFFQAISDSERLAQVRVAANPDDREGLFALCMTTGLVTDFAVLVERRRFGSYSLSKRNQVYARKLLAFSPPVYDAYTTVGTVEYVVGSLPFFLRWLVRFDQIKGSKEKAAAELQLVAEHGRYYGPLARIMLTVIHMREKRPAEAEKLLEELVHDFPENPLFRRELERVGKLANPAQAGTRP
ncbi:MAG TPA: hypothetical protein VGH38_25680 [Bryobacteraceae bacterium]